MDAKKAIVDDAATWTQAAFMAVPVLVYGLVYCSRLATYRYLGISQTLIYLRLEDVLFLAVVYILAMFVYVGCGAIGIVGSKNKGEALLAAIHLSMVSVFFIQLVLLASIKLSTGNASFDQFKLLLGQGFFLGVWTAARWSIRYEYVNHDSRLAVLWIAGIASCVFALLIGFYLHFQQSMYQVCTEDHAFIAGYDDQGRAIEKLILSVDDKGVCTLSEGYVLADVTGKELREERFAYVEVVPRS